MPSRFADEPLILEAFHYWNGLRRGRVLPERRDVDPLTIPRHLFPHLALIDVLDQGARVRFRLIGDSLRERFGPNRIGVFFDEFITGPYLDYTKSYYRDLWRLRRPVFSASRLIASSGWECLTKRLVMPLSTGGDEVTMAFAAQVFAPLGRREVKPTAFVLPDLDIEELSRAVLEV